MSCSVPPQKKEELPDFNEQHSRELKEAEANCYRLLHRPRVVKVRLYKDEIWYVCEKCLKKFLKKYPELKKRIMSFGR